MVETKKETFKHITIKEFLLLPLNYARLTKQERRFSRVFLSYLVWFIILTILYDLILIIFHLL